MLSRPTWAVWSFSLLSKSTFALPDVSAMPLFAVPDSQPCTRLVTSTVTYWPAVATLNVAMALPVVGWLAAVTPVSVHAEVTGSTLTVPAVFTRLTKNVTFARATCAAVMPAGKPDRSNWIRPVLPLPT